MIWITDVQNQDSYKSGLLFVWISDVFSSHHIGQKCLKFGPVFR